VDAAEILRVVNLVGGVVVRAGGQWHGRIQHEVVDPAIDVASVVRHHGGVVPMAFAES